MMLALPLPANMPRALLLFAGELVLRSARTPRGFRCRASARCTAQWPLPHPLPSPPPSPLCTRMLHARREALERERREYEAAKREEGASKKKQGVFAKHR